MIDSQLEKKIKEKIGNVEDFNQMVKKSAEEIIENNARRKKRITTTASKKKGNGKTGREKEKRITLSSKE